MMLEGHISDFSDQTEGDNVSIRPYKNDDGGP